VGCPIEWSKAERGEASPSREADVKKTTTVEIYSATHRIIGQVSPGPAGLFSFLNLPTESSVEVEEAELSLLYQVGQISESCPRLWLVKSEIVAVLVRALGELGPASSIRGGYTKPFPHAVRIVIGGYELRGLIQGGGRFDFRSIMFEGESRFLPLFDGKLCALLFPKVREEAPGILFNRGMVNAISLQPREGGSTPSGA
jgi:hypothetical protein